LSSVFCSLQPDVAFDNLFVHTSYPEDAGPCSHPRPNGRGTPAGLEGFLKGILHGIKFSYSNPEIARKALGRYLRLSDAEVIEETYKRTLEVSERIPFVPPQAIDTFVRLSGESSTRSAAGVLEMRILRQIESEGFVNGLYSGK